MFVSEQILKFGEYSQNILVLGGYSQDILVLGGYSQNILSRSGRIFLDVFKNNIYQTKRRTSQFQKKWFPFFLGYDATIRDDQIQAFRDNVLLSCSMGKIFKKKYFIHIRVYEVDFEKINENQLNT